MKKQIHVISLQNIQWQGEGSAGLSGNKLPAEEHGPLHSLPSRAGGLSVHTNETK